MSEVLETPKETRISHSMGDAYNACQRRFEFAHVYGGTGLEPLELPNQLARGIFGHRVLAAFFEQVKGRETDPVAINNGKAAAAMILTENMIYAKELTNVIMHWINNRWPELGWKILEIEKKHFMKMGEGIYFPFTVDLLVEENGQLVVIDHKFSADDYGSDMLDLYPQLPKYIGGLRTEGINVAFGRYNFIRTRSIKDLDEKIKIVPVKPLNARIKNSFQDQVDVMQRIMSHTGKYHRNISNNCSYCPFKDICRIEMRGDDPTALIEANYKPNTYGYGKDEF